MPNLGLHRLFATSWIARTTECALRTLVGTLLLFWSLETPRAQTTTYSWDANGGGAGTGGSGTWGNAVSNTNWTADGTTFVLWANIADQANAVASFGDIAGVVSLTASFTVNSLEFLVNGYVLESNTGRNLTNVTGNVTVGSGALATLSNTVRLAGSSGFAKLGDGTLALFTASTYTGATTISGGTVTYGINQALVNSSLEVQSGATLDLAGFTHGVTATGGPTLSGSGTITGSAGSAFTYQSTANSDFGGVLGGDLALSKLGSGTLTLSGSSGNTFTGVTTVSVGTLVLNKTGVNAIGGDLIIGDAGSTLDTVSLSAAHQIADTAVVTISNSGRFNLNGHAETIGALAEGAAGVQNINLGGGALTVSGSSASTFAGNIALGTGGVLTFGGLSGANLSGAITGAGSLVKAGAGTLTLSGTNTYSGATTISNGTVAVNGRVGGSGITVQSGGELAGTGTVGALVTVESGGTIAPGNSPGNLTLTNGLTWNAGGNYDWEIFNLNSTAGEGWDLITVQNGAFTFSGLSESTPFNINIFSLSGTDPDAFGPLAGLAPNTEYTWKILQHNAAITGFNASHFNLNTGSFINNVSTGLFALELGDGDTSLNLVYTTGEPVPEPGTWLAAALLTAAAWWRWRRHGRAANC